MGINVLIHTHNMKVEKKYTIIQLDTDIINRELKVNLSYGDIEGPYYSQTHPQQIFDTEEEAIQYAFEKAKYYRWIIVPVITFENN